MDNTHLEPSDGFNLYTSCNEDDDISSDDFFVNDEERLIHVNPVQRKGVQIFLSVLLLYVYYLCCSISVTHNIVYA